MPSRRRSSATRDGGSPSVAQGSKTSPSPARPVASDLAPVSRRAPTQERSRRRVEEMLDAAAADIAEVGIEATSTNRIAARAGVSVGSLYQFFPNRDAIVRELAARYLEELGAIYDKAISFDAVSLSIAELVKRVLDPLSTFHQRNPAYAHVYHATNAPGAGQGSEADLKAAVVARAAALIRARAPGVQPAAALRHATVVIETMHTLLSVAARAKARERQALVQELARLLELYGTDVELGKR